MSAAMTPEACREALLGDPANPDTHLQVATALAAGEQFCAAQQEYRRAKCLGADAGDVAMGEAFAQLAAGSPKAALEALAESTAPTANIYRAAALCLARRTDEARRLSLPAPNPDPAPPERFCWLVLHAHAGNLEVAADGLRELIDACPQFLAARRLLAQVAIQRKDYAAARGLFAEVLARAPGDREATCGRITCLHLEGAWERAFDEAGAAMRQGVRAPALYEVAANAALALKRYRPAAGLFRRLLEDPERRPKAVQGLARSLAEAGQREEFTKLLELLSEDERRLPLVELGAAILAARTARFNEACQGFRAYLETANGDLRAWFLYAKAALAWAEAGDSQALALGRELAQTYAQRAPGSGETWVLQAWLAWLRKDLDACERGARAAEAAGCEDAEVHYLQGQVLRERAGAIAPKEAYEAFSRALKLDKQHERTWQALACATMSTALARNRPQDGNERVHALIQKATEAGCRRELFHA